MIHDEDRELEEKLRSLPPGAPPGELRERILRAAERAARPRWTRAQPLAYALCLLVLVALDIAIDAVQSDRLSRLVGDGRRATVTEGAGAIMPIALHQREALLLAMVEKELLQ